MSSRSRNSYKILLVLFWLPMSNNKIIPPKEVSRKSILNQFPNHIHLVHFDNHSYHYLDDIFDDETKMKQGILFNYDTITTFSRPLGFKFTHLVFLRDWKNFNRFNRVAKNIRLDDILIFITRRSVPDLKKVFYYTGVENANVIFIYKHNTHAVYTANFFGNKGGILRSVEHDEKGEPMLYEYYNTFKNFQGFKFKVAFSNCEPYIYKYGDDIEGPEYKILRILMQVLNFQVEFIDFSNKTRPRTAMINAVHNRKVHIAIGCLSNTIKRNKLVDFTSDIKMEFHTAIFSSFGYNKGPVYKIFEPFNKLVWFSLLMCVLCMGFLLKKSTEYLDGVKKRGFFEYVKIPFRNIVEQPVNLPSKELTIRLFYLSWLMVALIITNSYKGKLASTLIKPLSQDPETLHDLVQKHYKFQISHDDPSYLEETLSNSSDQDFRTIMKNQKSDLDLCAAMLKMLEGRIAVINEMTSIQYSFWNECKNLMTKEEIGTIRIIKKTVLPNSHVWALQQAAPYARRFGMAIGYLQCSGIVTGLYNTHNLSRQIPYSNQQMTQDDITPLNIDIVFAPFLILFWGAISSTIAFVLELIYNQYERRLNTVTRIVNYI